MNSKIRSFFSLRRVMTLLAFLVGLFIFIGMFNQTAHIYNYRFDGKYLDLTFNNAVCGNDYFSYEYYRGFNEDIKYSYFTIENGNINFDVSPIAIEIVAFVLIFAAVIAVNVIPFFLKNKKTNMVIDLSCAGIILACAVLIFLMPVFAKSSLVKALNGVFSTGNAESNIDKIICSSFAPGFWAIIVCILIVTSDFVKDCFVGEVKNHKWHKGMIYGFKKAGAWLKGLFAQKEKKNVATADTKKHAPKAEAEVVTSPRVEVNDEPNQASEPEVERVSPTPKPNSNSASKSAGNKSPKKPTSSGTRKTSTSTKKSSSK